MYNLNTKKEQEKPALTYTHLQHSFVFFTVFFHRSDSGHVLKFRHKKKNGNISTFSSSGTTGLKQSKINLDLKTSLLQTKALENIFSGIINKNKDIFFVEKKQFLSSRESMTAKGAAIKGFSQLCKNKYFLL